MQKHEQTGIGLVVDSAVLQRNLRDFITSGLQTNVHLETR